MGELLQFPIDRKTRRANLHASAGNLSSLREAGAFISCGDKILKDVLEHPGTGRMFVAVGINILMGPEALATTVVVELGMAGAEALRERRSRKRIKTLD